jgi:hypothetical protein
MSTLLAIGAIMLGIAIASVIRRLLVEPAPRARLVLASGFVLAGLGALLIATVQAMVERL